MADNNHIPSLCKLEGPGLAMRTWPSNENVLIKRKINVLKYYVSWAKHIFPAHCRSIMSKSDFVYICIHNH